MGASIVMIAVLVSALSGTPDRLRRGCGGPPMLCATAESLHDAFDGGEVVAGIRVHGNVATADDEIRRLAGVAVGSPLEPGTITEIAARLRATHRFKQVDVLKRFASIADPTQIVLVIIVDEGAVAIERTGDAGHPTRVVRRRATRLMFLPVLSAEDGYGLTYGAQLGLPHPIGTDSRLTFPLTWGGDKRVAAELEKTFDAARWRLSGGGSVNRRTHPFFDRDEDRDRIWARVEREVVRALRVGATAGWQHVAFSDAAADGLVATSGNDSFAHAGADVTFDTRLDPLLARNAVYARAAWDHFGFRNGETNSRSAFEGRGYLGLLGQSVLVVRAIREDAARPLPGYLQPMLGGLANVRGFRAGTAVGDTLAAGSVELRVPLTSPMHIARLGVSAFVDAGAVYDKGDRLADQTLKKGVGGSVWFSAAFVRFNLAVARGFGSSTRVHFGGNLSF